MDEIQKMIYLEEVRAKYGKDVVKHLEWLILYNWGYENDDY